MWCYKVQPNNQVMNKMKLAKTKVKSTKSRLFVLGLLLAWLVTSCGTPTTVVTNAPSLPTTQTSPTQPVATPTGSVATTSAAATTNQAGSVAAPTTLVVAATTQAVVPSGDFQNPVLNADFPDPYVLKVGSTFYAYATNAGGKNIQVTSSTDLVNWKTPAEAMPILPPWANPDSTLVWAPEVASVNGHYDLYFTARDSVSNKQCVGVATGDQPDKFSSNSQQPLVCHPNQGGDIDQDVFRDTDGKLYLYYKNDGNCCGLTTHIFVQSLTSDGLNVSGQPIQLISNDQSWEGAVIEAPTMFKHDGNYYLFFSGNDYSGLNYAVGYATCKAATGPCQQASENPILKSSLNKPPVIGPGHQALLQVGNQTWMFYHAWEVTAAGKGDRRLLWMDKVDWVNGKPQVEGPTTKPQPVPDVKS